MDPEPLAIDGMVAGSQFGFAVANLGDVDLDSHEGMHNGSACVYVGTCKNRLATRALLDSDLCDVIAV